MKVTVTENHLDLSSKCYVVFKLTVGRSLTTGPTNHSGINTYDRVAFKYHKIGAVMKLLQSQWLGEVNFFSDITFNDE